jgi:ribonuclease P protein component
MAEKCYLEDVKKDVTSLPSKDQTFPKEARILKKGLFKNLFERGSRFRGDFCIIDYLLTNKEIRKLGITASAKQGCAVKRNIFKRLSREIFRTHKELLPPGCFIGIRPKGKIENVTFTGMLQDFQALASHVNKPR